MLTRSELEHAYSGKKVLVTGNTGFKGSWLCLWLCLLGAEVFGYALEPQNEKDHFVVLQLNQRMRWYQGDIRDANRLNMVFNMVKPDYVFHLAAQALVGKSYHDPKLTFDTNIGGSVNVLEAIRHCNSVKSLVYVTSDKCYKNQEWVWGYRENDELFGDDPYSASKSCAEIVFSSYKNNFLFPKLGLSSVRTGNVIGGGDWSENRILPDCIRALLEDNPILIRNPKAIRPWQHVLNALYGYLTVAVFQFREPEKYSDSWNFGPDESDICTVEEIAQRILAIWGGGIIQNGEKCSTKENTRLMLNSHKAYTCLDWKPKWDLARSLDETVQWYRAFTYGEIISESQIESYME